MEYNPFDLTVNPYKRCGLITRFKNWRRRRKFIKERAEKGWSRYDAWDFDVYLAIVISGGLECLAKRHYSLPHGYTSEEWSKKLLYIAECFKQYLEEPENQFFEAYDNAKIIERKDGCITLTDNEELRRAYLDEEKRLYEEKMKRLKEGFDLLYEIFPNLWD